MEGQQVHAALDGFRHHGTIWLGADRHGRVGLFADRLCAAVPTNRGRRFSAIADVLAGRGFGQAPEGEPWSSYRSAPRECDPRYELEGHVHPGDRARHIKYPRRRDRAGEDYLFFVDDVAPFADLIELGRATRLRSGEGVALLAFGLANPEHVALHERLNCRGCFCVSSGHDGWAAFPEHAARCGLFVYLPPMLPDEHVAAVYGRIVEPGAPMVLADLPDPSRRALEANIAALPVDFTRDVFVQPAELVPCRAGEMAAFYSLETHTIQPWVEPPRPWWRFW